MRRRISATTAGLIVVGVALAAASLGYAVHKSDPQPSSTGTERVLSQEPRSPQLPVYHPGSGWSPLPTPPPREPTVNTVGGYEEPTEPYEPPYEPYEPEEGGGGGGSGGRCYGITFGPTC